MRSTWWVWPGLTGAMAVLLGGVAWWLDNMGAGRPGGLRVSEAAGWISAGIATSLVTRVFGRATVKLFGLKSQPVARLYAETSLRMAVPLSVLLAIAIVRRDLLQDEGVLYFLPFQFITIVVGIVESTRRVN